LIFTFVAENQQTVIWQSRNFYEQARSKANTYGNIYDYLVLYRHSGNLGGIALGVGTESVRLGRRLVIVEDPVSAIKIARQSDCMPLLGSSVQPHKINAVAGLYSRLIVWLDEDKLAESMRIAQLARMLGMEVKVVHTKLDPKEYDDSEIETHLQ